MYRSPKVWNTRQEFWKTLNQEKRYDKLFEIQNYEVLHHQSNKLTFDTDHMNYFVQKSKFQCSHWRTGLDQELLSLEQKQKQNTKKFYHSQLLFIFQSNLNQILS